MSPACASSRCALCTCSTAVCSTRRNAAVCSGSSLAAARQLLDRLVEVGVQVAAQLPQVGAAGREDALAVGVVEQRVEQMLEREVRVAARHRLAEGDVEDDLDGGGEHWYRLLQASSIVGAQRESGASRPAPSTVSTLVSATSHG